MIGIEYCDCRTSRIGPDAKGDAPDVINVKGGRPNSYILVGTMRPITSMSMRQMRVSGKASFLFFSWSAGPFGCAGLALATGQTGAHTPGVRMTSAVRITKLDSLFPLFIRSVKFGIELFDPTRDLTSHAMSRNGRCVRFLSF